MKLYPARQKRVFLKVVATGRLDFQFISREELTEKLELGSDEIHSLTSTTADISSNAEESA